MNTASLDWLWYAAAAALALLGIWLGYAALLRDRAKGRRRCPKCWYSMEGVPGTLCPECGHDAGSPKRLLRTRRRWGRGTLAGLLLLAGYVSWSAPNAQRDGWIVLVPSTALVIAAPPASPRGGVPLLSGIPITGQLFTNRAQTLAEELTEETWRRAGMGRLWRWQSHFFVARCLSAKAMEPDAFVHAPPRWIAGRPMPIIPGRASATQLGRVVTVTIRDEAGEWHSNEMAFVKPGADGHARIRLSHAGIPLYESPVNLGTQLVNTPEELLEPVSGPLADALVQQVLAPRIARADHDELQILVNDRRGGPVWDSIDFAIGVVVEVWVDGTLAGRGAALITWDYPVWKDWIDLPIVWTSPTPPPQDPSRITLVVKSDIEAAMDAYSRNPFTKKPRAWRGELRVTPKEYSHPDSPAIIPP